jgi:hypothetical protein
MFVVSWNEEDSERKCQIAIPPPFPATGTLFPGYLSALPNYHSTANLRLL